MLNYTFLNSLYKNKLFKIKNAYDLHHFYVINIVFNDIIFVINRYFFFSILTMNVKFSLDIEIH